jgi:NADH-quinone oxidoreductase subunit C
MAERLTLDQIHGRLRERFGDKVSLQGADTPGDTWVLVAAEALFDVVRFLRDDPTLAFNGLQCISGVCYGAGAKLASVYHLDSYANAASVCLHVEFEDRAHPHVASLTPLYSAADWHERETFDLLGIVYDGHPNLVRILCAEDWEGHPLRKDYEPPKVYHGIRNDI